MKPLVATRGMKEGTVNEKRVLTALPDFISNQHLVLVQAEGGARPTIQPARYDLNYLREIGFVSSKRAEILGDSPDGVCGIHDRNQDSHLYCGVEIKTMTSPSTIECARAVAERCHSFVCLKQIGTLQTSNALFKEMIPNPTYRSQCLHHSAVLDTMYILYVIAKGSRSAQGSIL